MCYGNGKGSLAHMRFILAGLPPYRTTEQRAPVAQRNGSNGSNATMACSQNLIYETVLLICVKRTKRKKGLGLTGPGRVVELL